jgi:hypothetical protein
MNAEMRERREKRANKNTVIIPQIEIADAYRCSTVAGASTGMGDAKKNIWKWLCEWLCVCMPFER